MRFLFTIFLASCFIASSAQFKTDLKKEPTFVFHTTSIDLKTVQDILNTSFGDAVGRWGSPKDNYSGFGASYIQGVTNHLDFMASLNGALVWYPFRKPGYELGKKLLLEGDIAVNIKLLTEKSWLIPYLTIGIGGYRGSNTFGAYAPLGIGVQARVSPKITLFGNFQYRAPVTAEAAHHLLYNFGGGIPISLVFKNSNSGRAKNYNPPMPYKNASDNAKIVITDTDGDGVEDDSDKCPSIKGPATNSGCPVQDADGDGIPDVLDKCPDVAGFAKYDGCPLPDRDGDGIADDFDKCPDVPGVQQYFGCPDPNAKVVEKVKVDEKAKAEEEAKAAAKAKEEKAKEEKNKPANKQATNNAKKDSAKVAAPVGGKKQVKGEPLRNIFYAPNQNMLDELTTYNLEQTLKSLRNNPLYGAQIKGFTDSDEAKIANNKELAINRANAIVQYLTGKGIDKSRLTVIDGGVDKNATFNTSDNAGHRRAEIAIVE